MLRNGAQNGNINSESHESFGKAAKGFRIFSSFSSSQKLFQRRSSGSITHSPTALSSTTSLNENDGNHFRPASSLSFSPSSLSRKDSGPGDGLEVNKKTNFYRRSSSTDDFGISHARSRKEIQSLGRPHTRQSFSVSDVSNGSSYPNIRKNSVHVNAPMPSFPEGSTAVLLKHHSGSKSASAISNIAPSHSNSTTSRRPYIHPAFLSQVAVEFRKRLNIGDRVKDGLLYKDAFLGSEAVDVLMHIVRTTDRNLALLLGRALDSQKMFHDVTYSHRLRDSLKEVYQYRRIISPPPGLSSMDSNGSSIENNFLYTKRRANTSDSFDSVLSDSSTTPTISSSVQVNSLAFITSSLSAITKEPEAPETEYNPHGVFTLLTECYSSTCSRNRLCYSISCPRRLEQQARLHLKVQPVLSGGSTSITDKQEEDHRLWSENVPKQVVDQIDVREWKRQEIIFEVIYTERDFVRDLEYIRDFWIKPLSTSNVIPENNRQQFIRCVFHNIMQIHAVNSRLSNALNRTQTLQPVVNTIGDLFLDYVPKFEPFIKYGANQAIAKFEFEREKSTNRNFANYVHEVERLRESRKLELNGYLTKPTTRLARYPLLLSGVLKYTDKDNPDTENIPRVIEMIREFLTKLNYETGKTENRLSLLQLNEQLSCSPADRAKLTLFDPSRLLIFKGVVKLKASSYSNGDTENDIHMFLLDNFLLLCKIKIQMKRRVHKLHLRPLPLELLSISYIEDSPSRGSLPRRPSSALLTNPISITKSNPPPVKAYGLQLAFIGARGFSISLYLNTLIARDQWKQHIEKQQDIIRKRHLVFESRGICCQSWFTGNKLLCAVAYDAGRKLLFGTYKGLYISSRKSNNGSCLEPIFKLQLPNISQLDVIEEHNVLLLLAEKILYELPLDALDSVEQINTKSLRRVTGHVSFVKTGFCMQRILVCAVKSTVLNTTLRIYEADRALKNKKTQSLKKPFGNQATLKIFTEVQMPMEALSVHFLKTKLCVGSFKGFDIISLENAVFQSLLNPADTSFRFLEKREDIRPIAMFRLRGEFLLCYSDFAFFVNTNGWKSRQSWMINWEGQPQGCALCYPYILAFEPDFIEIRNAETAELVQIIMGQNIKLLTDGRGLISEGGEILYSTEPIPFSSGENPIVHSLILPPANAAGPAL